MVSSLRQMDTALAVNKEIKFQILYNIDVAKIMIYNLKGQKVKTFHISSLNTQSINTITWNGDDENGNPVSSGVYLYRLIAGDLNVSRKCLLLK